MLREKVILAWLDMKGAARALLQLFSSVFDLLFSLFTFDAIVLSWPVSLRAKLADHLLLDAERALDCVNSQTDFLKRRAGLD